MKLRLLKVVFALVKNCMKYYCSSEERKAEQIYEKIFVGNVHALSKEEVDAFICSISNLDGQELKEKLVHFAQQ